MKRQKNISITGPRYIQPIFSLLEITTNLKKSENNKTNTGFFVNGYALSIIILLMLILDSAINRIRFLKKDKTKIENYKFFNDTFKDTKFKGKIIELYLIRDVITHNHVWLINFDYDNNYNENKIYKKLLEGYGDKKYKLNINSRTKKTKILKINIIPTIIDLTDMKIIFKNVIEIIDYINSNDPKYFPLNQHFKFGNEFKTLHDVLKIISNK